jgi:hypothetical protein
MGGVRRTHFLYKRTNTGLCSLRPLRSATFAYWHSKRKRHSVAAMNGFCPQCGTNTVVFKPLAVRKHLRFTVIAKDRYLFSASAHSRTAQLNYKCEGSKRQCRLRASSTSLQPSEPFGEEPDDWLNKARLATICKYIALGLAVLAWLKISINRPASLFCSATIATRSTPGGENH